MSEKSWLDVPSDSDFSIHNLPFGVFSEKEGNGGITSQRRRCATILGNTVIDLSVLAEAGLLDATDATDATAAPLDDAHTVFDQPTLNAFLGHCKPAWLAVRRRLQSLLRDGGDGDRDDGADDDRLRRDPNLQRAAFHPVERVRLHLPLRVGDYTDFYSSREHATNVGTMFRGKDNALQPNWLHLPVGYHGRSSTVVVTGQPIRRPCGQLQTASEKEDGGSVVRYGPCQQLDFELEVAAVVGGPPNAMGTALTVAQAKDRLFGLLLMNDWSARDVQKWEYVPLGPFTSKNFATTVSPWIVMTEALQPAPTSAVAQTDPVPLPYLRDPDYGSYDVALTVALQPAATAATTTTKNTESSSSSSPSSPTVICQSNYRNLYWNAVQQLVHHSVTGCVLRPGDLLGSGTISGSTPSSFGSLLELSWRGTRPVPIGGGGGGATRTFLQDGDTVTMRGVCTKSIATAAAAGGETTTTVRVGFGDCSGTILPAEPLLFDEEGKATVGSTTTSAASSTPSTKAEAVSSDRYQNFKLYSYWRSSSSWRVRVALAAKGLEYETVCINLTEGESHTAEYLSKNPLGQVPLLECTDAVSGKCIQLSQSLAIVQFLDNAFPNRRSLIPRDPLDNAAALEIVEIINAGTQPLQNILYLGRLEKQSDGRLCAQDLAREANEKGLAVVEALVQRRRKGNDAKCSCLGPFALGTFSPTVADAFVIPQLFNARRFGVDVNATCPTLVEIEAACNAHPWFQTTHPKVQPDAPVEKGQE